MGCGCNKQAEIRQEIQAAKNQMDMLENKKLAVQFNHGCGDCCQFAHLLQLYKRRGFDIRVRSDSNKKFIWQVAEVDFCTEQMPDHRWLHPDNFLDLGQSDLERNKTAGNINKSPLPPIGKPAELWEELIGVELDATKFIGEEAREEAKKFIGNLPHPIVCLHTQGNTWIDRKNLLPETIIGLQKELLDRGYSVVLLDWDNRTPASASSRIKKIEDWGKIDLERLAAVYELSDLLIGVDSGPLHFARLNKIPAVGVWRSLPPCRCAIPSKKVVNLVTSHLYPRWHSREELWNLKYYQGQEPTAKEIAQAAQDMLEKNPEDDDGHLTGRYNYVRVGYDQRVLEFKRDHIIEEGARKCEMFWKKVGDTLTIYGDSGPTCHLKNQGDKWTGAWINHEKMPIELVPLDVITLPWEKMLTVCWSKDSKDDLNKQRKRYETLFRLTHEIRPEKIVEIGVGAGYATWTMLEASPEASAVGIDADVVENAWENAVKINKFRNFSLMLVNSHDLKRLPDCDLCFIDGERTEEGCYQDLVLAEKSAKNIIVNSYAEVKAAVDRFLEQTKLKGKLVDDGFGGLYLIRVR